MSYEPLASVIVNNYNYAGFLRKAIDSALAQRWERTEVVVVDDGSTDESREIIADYRERVIPVLKDNGGQASAFNAGFDASRGEIVLFLDADDVLLPSAVAEVVRAWRPGVAKAHFPLRTIDGRGRPLGGRTPTEPLPSGDLRALIRSAARYSTPPTSGNAFSRRVLRELLPMPEERWAEIADQYLVLLAPLLGDVRAINEPQGLYRRHEANRWRMSELDAERIHGYLYAQTQRARLLREFTAERGGALPASWRPADPNDLQVRLASLRLDPDAHPRSDDQRRRLALRGIGACWRQPSFGARRSLLFSLWFVCAAALPPKLARTVIELGFVRERRPGPLRQLVS